MHQRASTHHARNQQSLDLWNEGTRVQAKYATIITFCCGIKLS